jgi:hypothetical protein
VTTARTRAPSPSTAICGVMADKKSMAAKPNPQNSIRNGPRLRAAISPDPVPPAVRDTTPTPRAAWKMTRLVSARGPLTGHVVP